jgi:hypothetical protein
MLTFAQNRNCLVIIFFLMSGCHPFFELGVVFVWDQTVCLHGVPFTCEPVRIVNLQVCVHIYPQFFLCIIPNALILLMQSIKCSTDNIIQCFCCCAFQLDPLTLLYQFKDICSCSHTVWQSACCITC